MKHIYVVLFASIVFARTAPAETINPFDDVFRIMTRPRAPDSMGCRGCHVSVDAINGLPHFGDTQSAVETYLRTDDFGAHVAGRRNSPIARRLRHDGDPASMPRQGLAWTQNELDKLYAWLDAISYPRVNGLVDTFVGTVIDPNIWAVEYDSDGGIASQSDGLYLSAYPNDAASGTFVTSKSIYSLFESSAYVKMPGVVNRGNINNQFAIFRDWNNRLVWSFEDGNLFAIEVVSGIDTIKGTFSYDSSQHAWLRIREAGGNVYWETSVDGVNWVVRTSSPVAFPLGSINVQFTVSEWGAGIADPGTARYSNLNVGTAP